MLASANKLGFDRHHDFAPKETICEASVDHIEPMDCAVFAAVKSLDNFNRFAPGEVPPRVVPNFARKASAGNNSAVKPDLVVSVVVFDFVCNSWIMLRRVALALVSSATSSFGFYVVHSGATVYWRARILA